MEIGRVPVEQLGSRRRGQPLELEGRQASLVERRRVAVADGGHERDRLALETPRDERQRPEARAIEPVRIVEDEDQRRGVGRVADELVGAERDKERVRLEVVRDAERRLERAPLRGGQGVLTPADRMQQLVQSGEGELGLGLDADGRQRARPDRAGALPRTVQQRRLADARLAAEQQPAAAFADVIDDVVEAVRLRVATYKCRSRVQAARRAHDARIGGAKGTPPGVSNEGQCPPPAVGNFRSSPWTRVTVESAPSRATTPDTMKICFRPAT